MKHTFRDQVRAAINDPDLQRALDNFTEPKRDNYRQAFSSITNPSHLRQEAQITRTQTIKNLDQLLATFTRAIESNGFHVHRASNAAEANRIVIDLVRASKAKLVLKSKTMLSEEIRLNQALQEEGFEVIETDLGEFILQLRDEPPSHIIAPAIHLRKEQIADTFTEKLGMRKTTDIAEMNSVARSALREKFLTDSVGISGVNFGVAETGTISLVTNEGNGRMVTTLPRMHIALMGVERLVPTLNDLAQMLDLLPRSATGQKLTSYVALIQSPRMDLDPDGPDERHLILIDNGRLALIETPLADSLNCIRCGACLDVCPVYREIGGHAYNSVYPGPIGSVISPGLFGVRQFGHLAKVSTLCGACYEVCPVGINLPDMLLHVRAIYTEQAPQPAYQKWGVRMYSWLVLKSSRFLLAERFAALATTFLAKRTGWMRWLPPPFSGWTTSRYFPPFARKPFRLRFHDLVQNVSPSPPKAKIENSPPTLSPDLEMVDPVALFAQELRLLGAEFIPCDPQTVAEMVHDKILQLGGRSVLSWGAGDQTLQWVTKRLKESGIEMIDPIIARGDAELRIAEYSQLDPITIGLTGCVAGIAASGTLVVPSGEGRSQLASLLPKIHIAIIAAENIFRDLNDWFRNGALDIVRESQCVALISGPSRTSDIERTLTLGVHGPAQVLVYCVE